MRSLSFLLVVALTFAGCDDSSSESDLIMPLDDQRVRVNDTLLIDLRVRNARGDERWSFSAPSIDDIDRTADLYQSMGTASFRWAPLASHAGNHQFTFSVSSSAGTDSETINIQVIQAGGAPRFIQPPPGGTFDLQSKPCVEVVIEVIDEDDTQVEIIERPPLIEGGEMEQSEDFRATWRWCPTQEQVDASLRYTLHLEADDQTHPPVRQNYEIVLIAGEKPDCPGQGPQISGVSPTGGEAVMTVQDYEVRATITDDQGLKDLPVLFYSEDEPGSNPDVTQMDMVTFEPSEGDQYVAHIPNLELEVGREQTVYFVVSATDNDDDEGTSCDHTTRSPVHSFVAQEPENPDLVGYCEPCTTDRQCQGGLCVVPPAEAGDIASFCGVDCDGSCSEGTCTEVTSRGGSVDNQCVPDEYRCDGGGGECVPDSHEPDNDDMTTAPAVSVGDAIEGTICPDDFDYYGIDLESDTQYAFTVTGWNAATTDLDVLIESPSGDLVGIGDSITDLEEGEFCAEESGEYFIIILGYSPIDTGPYLAEVVEAEGPCCSNDLWENNNSMETATGIVCGSGATATICPDDEDYFQIYAESAGDLTVMTVCEDGAGDLDLRLFSDDGTQVGQSLSGGCDEEVTITVTTGNYYARVWGWGAATGEFLIDCELEAGSGCSDTADCPSGTVCDPTEGCIDEVCFSPGTPGDCPTGHTCPEPGGTAASSVCATSCSGSESCRSGYTCKRFAEGRFCVPNGDGDTGESCESFQDCAGERICLTAGSTGYCAEIGCTDYDDCPSDSFCVNVGGSDSYCLQDCFLGDYVCDSNPGTCTETTDTDGFGVYVCALSEHSVP